MVITIDIKKIIIFLLITGAFVAGFFVAHKSSSSSSSSDFPLINKAITADIGKYYIINFRPLRLELENIQKKYSQKTYIYFSYINNSSWIGLNEREEFTAASILKVPLAMSFLKNVESGKLNLNDKYTLEELDLNADFGELYKVGANKEFTVGELLKIMLEKSDNTAMLTIYNIFQRLGIGDPYNDVYNNLGWDFLDSIPAIDETPNYSKINLRALSNMFLALYNAKYINAENSNKILQYLSQTPFNDKIDAGVPDDIVVSHKIGVAGLENTFSDCGIVYAPNRNYILCLGSNGGDEKQASKFMAEISATVYRYVINN